MLKKSAWLLHLVEDKAPTAGRNRGLPVHKTDIVILTPETAATAGVVVVVV